jgi:hypothetical protein
MPYNRKNSAVGLEEAPALESEEDLFKRIKATLDKFVSEKDKRECYYEFRSVGAHKYRVNLLCNRFVGKADLFPTITRPYSWYIIYDDDEIRVL